MIRLYRKAVKDEIKPLEAPAATYINKLIAMQMHDGLLVKGSATNKAGIFKRKKRSNFYLWKSLKINLLQVDSAQVVRQD